MCVCVSPVIKLGLVSERERIDWAQMEVLVSETNNNNTITTILRLNANRIGKWSPISRALQPDNSLHWSTQHNNDT